MTSPVYWHPYIYRTAMKFLYGRHFESRYKAISEIIPEGASVVELCAGDIYLYRNYLKAKRVSYTGFDINSVFVQAAKRKNIRFFKHDLLTDTIEPADYIILQASLYQFIPFEEKIIRKLLDSTNKVMIIAEPVRNLSSSNNFFIRKLAKYSANPGKQHSVNRFNEDTILACFKKFSEFKEMKTMEGGREMIGIFRK